MRTVVPALLGLPCPGVRQTAALGFVFMLSTLGAGAIMAERPGPGTPSTRDVLTVAASDPEFQAKHPRKKEAPDVSGRMIDLAGVESKAYLAEPDGKSKAGILIFHEWWGLNEHIKSQADRLAELGYRALALDLYGGRVADSPDQARAFMQAVNEQKSRAIIDAAIAYLKEGKEGALRIGTIGWCFGGTWSMRAALQGGKDVHAAVVYYGELVTEPKALAPLSAPVLAHVARKDKWVTPAMGKAFETVAKSAGKSVTVKLYDADHAFANPSSPNHDSGSAAEAWRRTISFLEKHLGAP
jgi:carboxymethylenebutenolidase